MKKCFFLVVSILFLMHNGVTAKPLFSDPVDYHMNNRPESIVSMDFNNDGVIDLAVANHNKISLLFNNGDRTFSVPVDYDFGISDAMSICSADFDRDGDYDLAVTDSSSDNVYILMNNGDGTFISTISITIGIASSVVFTTDLNNDNNDDIITINYNTHIMTVLLGNGDGTFSGAVNYNVDGAPMSICSADFDKDGDNDIGLCTLNGFVSILLNNGDGSFAIPIKYPLHAYILRAILTADFDGDGDYDIVTALQNTDEVAISINNGDGTFADPIYYSTQVVPEPYWYLHPWAISSADFDGDGDNDLAVGYNLGGSGKVSILLNNGNAVFNGPVDYQAGEGILSLVSADFDRDGDYDLAVANSVYHDISVLLNLSFCCFGSRGNMNYDLSGKLDVGDLLVLINYAFVNNYQIPCEDEADVNGDGSIDVDDVMYLIKYIFGGGPAPVACP